MKRILFPITHEPSSDPLQLMLLSALAKRLGGYETHLTVLSREPFSDALKRVQPDIVAASLKTGDHKLLVQALDHAKAFSPWVKTVAGGPHCTFFPEVVNQHNLDAICVGEGDFAWPSILQRWDKGDSVDDVPNIITRTNFDRVVTRTPTGEALFTNFGPRNMDLDSLPFHDFALAFEHTRSKYWGRPIFMAGRGCPYRCTYCFNADWNRLYKGATAKSTLHNRYSVERLCDELEHLGKLYPMEYIKFYDDVFAFKADEWLEEFAEVFPRRIGVPFHCLCRADNVHRDPRIVDLLIKAGLHSMTMSIEAGNAWIRENVMKRDMTEEDIMFSFRYCHERNVPVFGNVIMGVPVPAKQMMADGKRAIDYDVESLDFTLRLQRRFDGEQDPWWSGKGRPKGKRCRVFCEFPILFPYPGTELGQYCIDNNAFDGDYDKLHASYQSVSPLSCFTAEEKQQQRNLAMLSTACLLFPRTRDFVVNRLMKLPEKWSWINFVIYMAAKSFMVSRVIYPLPFSWKRLWGQFRALTRTVKIDVNRHFTEAQAAEATVTVAKKQAKVSAHTL